MPKKVSILRVQMSVVLSHDENENVNDIIKNSEYIAENSDDKINFINLRPLNYECVNKQRRSAKRQKGDSLL